MKNRNVPTMKDIAAKAGVSCSTVSMALRNNPKIPPNTCKRIQQLAAQLGYRTNPLVSSLMASLRTTRISKSPLQLALIHAHPCPPRRRRSTYYRQFVQNMKAYAERLGYRVEEFWVDAGGMSDHRISDILEARGIRGIILAPVHHSSRHFQLEWTRFAAVAIGHSMGQVDVHRADYDHMAVISLAMKKLLARGYRRIGLALNREMDDRSNHFYRAGFLGNQDDLPKRDQVPICWLNNLESDRLLKWMNRHKPEVVMSCQREIKGMLEELGWKVPDDIGFVDLDLTPENTEYAGVNQRRDLVGATAIDLVVEMLQRNEIGSPSNIKSVMVRPNWTDGKTIRPLQAPETPPR